MEIFIRSSSCISHYNTVSEDFFFEYTPLIPGSDELYVTPPNYKDFIPANTLRRTSNVLKMGIGAGLMCLKKANIEKPGAIVIGTGIGCYEDTDKFLKSIDENHERMLTPTAFIQSTHNTVAGQIGLLTKCHGYNFTYVHQNLSFEYALLDAMMLLKEKTVDDVLVGGLDELNAPLIEQFRRANHIKKLTDILQPLWQSSTKGYIAGEGAAFFELSTSPSPKCYGKINGVKPIQKIKDLAYLKQETEAFMRQHNIPAKGTLVLNGASGDSETDKKILTLTHHLQLPVAYFKHLCGEYFTASGFALWLACKLLEKQSVPASLNPHLNYEGAIDHILIVNHYIDAQYSLMSISKC